jgi:DNA polymerase-3 subunit epsilon
VTHGLILTRPLVAIDVEGTGTKPEHDRVIQIGIVRMFPDGSRSSFEQYINPEQPIPPDSTAVHGIVDADVALAPTFADFAEILADTLADADMTGFNVRQYDIPILRAEFARAGRTWPFAGRVLDSFCIFRDREPRTLSAAVRWYCGREHENAHTAQADAAAALDVLLGQLEQYPDLPRDLDALDKTSGGRQPDFATELGHLRWRDDGDLYIAFGKHAGRRLCDLDDGFLRWVARADFPTDVHAFVRAVRHGERPRAPDAPPLPLPPEPAETDDDWNIPF